MPYLVVKPSYGPVEIVDLADADSAVMGSRPGNDVVIAVSGVSRRHARVSLQGDDWVLEDLDSSTFVFVDHRKVQRHVLTHGTEFMLGDGVSVLFLLHPDPAAFERYAGPAASDADSPLESGRDTLRPLRELELLFEVGASINSSLDLDEVLDTILDKALVLTRAERGLIMLLENGELVPRVARNMDSGVSETGEVAFSRSFARRVTQDNATIVSTNVAEDPNYRSASIIAQSIFSIMGAPLRAKDTIIGCLYLDTRSANPYFQRKYASFFTALANQAALAIHNARITAALQKSIRELEEFYEERMRQRRLREEVEDARQVQQLMLPKDLPCVPGWSFAAHYATANRVGGDYYDFIRIDNQRLAVVVADVSGHDIAAALIMSMGRNLVRTFCTMNLSPAEVLTRTSRLLEEELGGQRFITMFLGILNLESGELICANAGHPWPLHLGRGSSDLGRPEAGGFPLGLIRDSTYTDERIWLAIGDVLLIYTDGLVEARSSAGAPFETHRLEKLARSLSAGPVDALVAEIYRRVAAFAGDAGLQDDATMVAFSAVERADEFGVPRSS